MRRGIVGTRSGTHYRGGVAMIPLLIVLALVLILFGVGFAADALWFVAIAVLVLWLLGFFMRSSGARWYRW